MAGRGQPGRVTRPRARSPLGDRGCVLLRDGSNHAIWGESRLDLRVPPPRRRRRLLLRMRGWFRRCEDLGGGDFQGARDGVASLRMRRSRKCRSGNRRDAHVRSASGFCPVGPSRLPGVVAVGEIRRPGCNSDDRRGVDRHQYRNDLVSPNWASRYRDAHQRQAGNPSRTSLELVGVPGHPLQQHHPDRPAPFGIGAISVAELVQPEGPTVLAAVRQRRGRETPIADPRHGRARSSAGHCERPRRLAPARAAAVPRTGPPRQLDLRHALDNAVAADLTALPRAGDTRHRHHAIHGVRPGAPALSCVRPRLCAVSADRLEG